MKKNSVESLVTVQVASTAFTALSALCFSQTASRFNLRRENPKILPGGNHQTP